MGNKKKIAFFAEKLYGGGVEKILQIILRNFDYEQYDVTLYSSNGEELREGFYPLEIKHFHYFLPNGDSKLRNFWAKMNNKFRLLVYYHLSPSIFYRLFIRRKYDVGIAFIEGYATRILSGSLNTTKKIAWVHTDMENNHWTDVAFRNKKEEISIYTNKFDKIVCVSTVIKDKMKSIYGLDNKAVVLHNPVEREKILIQSQDCLSCLISPSKDKIKIISLGSLVPVKGYDRLLSVAKRLKEENCNVEFFLLGSGNLREDIERRVLDNNLNDIIHLMGFKNNPYPYIKKCDIYICSSYAEGYNTAITEALVLGKAVVSTECSGVKEQLGEHNEYGICTPNTEEGLYEGIKLMLTGNNLEHYTKQAEIRGKDFSLDNSMKEIYKMIEG